MVNHIRPDTSGTAGHWMGLWLRRFAGHLVLGALATALVGALCVGTLGALCGWVMDLSSRPATWDDGFRFAGFGLGITLGAFGGIVGALFCGWAGLVAPPNRALLPPRALLGRIALGQVAGTLLAGATFVLWVLVQSQNTGQSFGRVLEDEVFLLLWAAPALMICGAIAGALCAPTAQRD